MLPKIEVQTLNYKFTKIRSKALKYNNKAAQN